MRAFRTADELHAAIGQPLGPSDWLLVDQARISTFADATGDHQWIHVDPARAADGPFGSTVAHGYLTLSLVPALVATMVDYAGWRVKLNYGSNRVRFPAAVPVDSSVRLQAEIADVVDTRAGIQVLVRLSMEVRHPDGTVAERPGLVAETVTVLADPAP